MAGTRPCRGLDDDTGSDVQPHPVLLVDGVGAWTVGGAAAPGVITIGGKAQFRHTVSNAADVMARLTSHPYPLALGGHIHARERLRFEGTPTRFEQSAAIVAPTSTGGMMFTSGITVYRITAGRIDDGRFVPLGLDRR